MYAGMLIFHIHLRFRDSFHNEIAFPHFHNLFMDCDRMDLIS
uniref:Uncharacterized protein n=1 Tax=Arundo donax TaxID=35708 RepID=A0A0A8ZNE5_ARUDO